MRYLSIFSGIESATVAWRPLHWSPVGFAEIEPFPCAVLAHHYGSNLNGERFPSKSPPNLGDVLQFKRWPILRFDTLIGGSPCQSFSVAGLRKGMADPRGNLTLTYLAIADKYKPTWIVWENVPGVLSSNEGKDFGAFLGGLVELGYGVAYRVLDAQFVRVDGYPRAVPQQRRRVFVVGYLGDWRRAAAVLFERESLQGYHPPRRQAGQTIAPTLSSRTTGGGGLGTDFYLNGGLVAGAVSSKWVKQSGGPAGDECYNLVVANTLTKSYHKSSAIAGNRVGMVNPIIDTIFQPRFVRNGRGAPSQVASALTSEAGRSGKGDSAQCVITKSGVRRLTLRECERLQGLPDDYTLVPYRGKLATDTPRYKALGNCFSANCVRWIGRRIQLVERLS